MIDARGGAVKSMFLNKADGSIATYLSRETTNQYSCTKIKNNK